MSDPVFPARPQTTPELGKLPLARDDVDRGCEVRADPDWLSSIWDQEHTRVLWLHGGLAPVFQGQLVLSAPSGELPENAIYLGRSAQHRSIHSQYVDASPDHAELILLTAPSDQSVPELHAPEVGANPVADPTEISWLGMRGIAAGLNDRDAGIFVEAIAIANWHHRNKYCPRCGTKTTVTQSGWVQVCPQDNSEHFPRTDPAVIVSITDAEDRILLGNNVAWGSGRYSTLAGFVEPGESLEAAVKREVYEESKLIVHSPRYLGSQPWPFPQSLMLGFTAVTDDPDAAIADQEEISEVRWFTRQQLREAAESGSITLPGPSSIARSLLDHWYGGPLPEPRRLEN